MSQTPVSCLRQPGVRDRQTFPACLAPCHWEQWSVLVKASEAECRCVGDFAFHKIHPGGKL